MAMHLRKASASPYAAPACVCMGGMRTGACVARSDTMHNVDRTLSRVHVLPSGRAFLRSCRRVAEGGFRQLRFVNTQSLGVDETHLTKPTLCGGETG